jgi:hypothetical protein
MSSTDKKKFKITETSKQASVDITSDKIILPADSADHLLVATVPSGANVTDTVNVEVEMSPDGENWCDALVKQSVTTPGSTTAEIIGNEQYADLTVNDPVFNGHGKGSLSFDNSGNTTVEDAGTRDFMHQHIEADKCFNQSMWIKSNVNPTTTYKPVLFRHGGYDNFSNAKTVQLTDIIQEGNLNATQIPNQSNPGLKTSNASGSFINPFKKSTDTNPNNSPNINYDPNDFSTGMVISANVKFNNFSTSPAYSAYEIFRITFEDSSGNPAGYIRTVLAANSAGSSGNGLFTQFFDSNGTNIGEYKRSEGSLLDGNWHHINCLYFKEPSGTSTNMNYYSIIAIDGSKVKPGSGGVSAQSIPDYQNLIVTSVEIGGGAYNIDMEIDNVCFFTGYVDTSTHYTTIYNNRKSPLDNIGNIGLMELKSCFTMGDGNDDTSNVILKDIVEPSSGRQLIKYDSNSTANVVSISPSVTGSPYLAAQKTTQNLVAANSDANREYMNMTYNGNLTSTTRTSASYNASPFYVSTDATPTQDLPDPADGFALSMWFRRVNNSVPGLYDWEFTSPLTLHFTNGAYILIQFLHQGTGEPSNSRRLRTWYVDSSGNSMRCEYQNIQSSLNGWHHVLLYIKGTGTNGAVTVSTTQADNDMKLFVDGTELVPDGAPSATTLDSSTSLTFDHIEFRKKSSSSFDDTGDIYAIDNLAFIRGSLDSSAISSIVANKNDLEAATLPQGTILTCLFKMGDGNNDVTSQDANFSIKNVIPTNDIRIVRNGTDTPFPIAQYATTDTPYNGLINSFTNVIDTASNFSISGWFKTTDIGTLFSNTGGAAATGLKVDLSGSAITASYLSSSLTTSVSGTFNDGNWHHIIMVMSSGSQLIVVDNLTSGTSNHTLVNGDLKGDNGFTLLGDGQENANNLSAASIDASKLNATLSNWSIHSEAIGTAGISQLYSNGHVRNIKNLPSVTASAIEAWWQLADTSNPAQDLTGSSPLKYEDGNSATLISQQVNADGATYVNGSINGNALTMSITKNFDFVNEVWVSDASGDAAICLSLNGFEEQAEYFALWKCSQTVPSGNINILDGNWHNLILSYRGINDLTGNNNVVAGTTEVRFGVGDGVTDEEYHFTISMDGYPMSLTSGVEKVGADYIGGLGATLATETIDSVSKNVKFVIENRHLRYDSTNSEEEYKPHAQFSAGIIPFSASETDPNNFRGSVDETSFHSQCFWLNQGSTGVQATINQEKPYTIYGRTTALDTRGPGKTPYGEGIPYPLLNPELLKDSGDINDMINTNQFINPIPKGQTQPWNSQPSIGGLEAWYRWGDTDGDCSVDIKDVRTHNASGYDRFLTAVELDDTANVGNVKSAQGESIYLQSQSGSTTEGSSSTSFVQVKLEDLATLVGDAACTIKNMSSQVLQYLRIKLTGNGTCDIGDDKLKVELHYKKRRMK